MIARRPIHPRLRPFVRTLWASNPAEGSAWGREQVLPTGDAHLVFRLSDRPLRLFCDPLDSEGVPAELAVVGGPRTSAYLRDVSWPAPSVGAQLRPGAAIHLLGVPAAALAEAHTSLEDLWGPAARAARDRLGEEPSLERRLKLFEALLVSRLAPDCIPHPIVTRALPSVARGVALQEIVEASGYSHRHFIALFREQVGITPKLYQRLQRFQRALSPITAASSLAEVALEAGYSDQAHLTRDFRAFAGIAPGDYRRSAPAQPNHVPIPLLCR